MDVTRVRAGDSQETTVLTGKRHARDCLHWSAHGRDGRALPEHPGPNLRIVHRLYVLDVDRDEPGGADLPDPAASHPMGRPGRVSGTLRLTGPSRVWSNGSCAEDGNDGSQAATTATPQLIMLPDGFSGGLGPALGAGMVRSRAEPARYRRPVHGGAARPPGGRRSGLALGWTGDLVPAPAAEATAALP